MIYIDTKFLRYWQGQQAEVVKKPNVTSCKLGHKFRSIHGHLRRSNAKQQIWSALL